MKIAYIILTQKVSSGVEKTLKQRANAILSKNQNFEFYILNSQYNKIEDNIQYIKIPHKYKSLSYYFNLLFRKFHIIESVINLKKLNYIVLRYPYADGSAKKFVSKYNVITEHHTFEREELINNIKGKKKFFNKIFDLIDLLNDILFANQMFQNTKGIIALTQEIGYNVLKQNAKLPINTITNGVDTSIYPLTEKIVKKNKKRIDLIMLASKYNSWHGIERIIKSIDNYRGETAFYLHIVGNIKKDELNINIPTILNDRIIFHGLLSQEKINEVIDIANIGVGTMALHKKKMNEACPLKIREYIARGLPFIYAYKDNDFDNSFPYAFQFTNDNSIIDMEKVASFYYNLQKKEKLEEELQIFAKNNLDLKVKASELIHFIYHLDNQSKPS